MSDVINILEKFEGITKNPLTFLCPQDITTNEVKYLLKHTYDYSKDEENKNYSNISKDALPELIVENFDTEQIWQQIELQNELLTNVITDVSKFVVNKKKLSFKEIQSLKKSLENIEEESNYSNVNDFDNVEKDSNTDKTDSEEDEVEIQQEPNLSSDEELSLGDSEVEVTPNKIEKTKKKSIVDDEFFKLEEMEKFLLSEEKKINDKEPDSGNDSEEGNSEDEHDNVDYFQNAEDDSDEEGIDENEQDGAIEINLKNPKYADFFDVQKDEVKKPKRNVFFEELEEELNQKEVKKSSFELREDRLKKRIEKFEEQAIEDKPWQLKGEITAETRPYNSLLEEIVEFDVGSRPAPVITEETTLKLEDIIIRRIRDKAFDSVERKEKLVQDPLEYKKKLVLNQEKSKQSLAQIYEQEYLQQKAALETNEMEEKVEDEPELHKNIKKMMHSLFIKLDALSNFHYTPKPAVPELKIISNLPAINMEEVAPVATSDAALLAPEELKARPKGDVLGKGERSDTDKKRERRKKKLKQREHALQKKKTDAKLEKMRPGLGNKYSKDKAKKLLQEVTKHNNTEKMDETLGSKSLKSSTAFFTQLQDEVKAQIKTGIKRSKGKFNNKFSVDSKRMKL